MKNRNTRVTRPMVFMMVIVLVVLISACSPGTSQGTPSREIVSTATHASLPVQPEDPISN
jgi:hypothetical protein